jgi:lipoate-protein ligase A
MEADSQWLLLQTGSRHAAVNMAIDEVLLETSSSLARPVLRFYSWSEVAATFGYFQPIEDVEKATTLRPLIRRPTGGGIVPHDHDWTYSLIFPPGSDWYRLKAVESYQQLHRWLQQSFTLLGLATELSPVPRPGLAGQCFVGAERFDLLHVDRKIAGAAQRRNRQGLLIQGSVQPPKAGLAKADWQKALCDAGHQCWSIAWIPWELSIDMETRILDLALRKYSQSSYNRRR